MKTSTGVTAFGQFFRGAKTKFRVLNVLLYQNKNTSYDLGAFVYTLNRTCFNIV